MWSDLKTECTGGCSGIIHLSCLSWRRGRLGISWGFELKAFFLHQTPFNPRDIVDGQKKTIILYPPPNYMVKVISFQSARMPMSFRISCLSSVCQHIFLYRAGSVFHLQKETNFYLLTCKFPCFQPQAKQSIDIELNFLTQQERDEVGMDGFTSRKEPWEWAQTIDTLLLSIVTSFCTCVNKIPTDLYGNYMAAIFGYHPSPPAYTTGVVTRSLSTSIPNP